MGYTLAKKIEIASYYLKQGWSMLPMKMVKNNDGDTIKKPIVAWKRLQTTPPTLTEVTEWLKDGAGLGLITGQTSKIVVIDDDRIKHGLNEWGFNSPIIATTKSGGKHYYFKFADGITNTANPKLYLDIRGEGGYVVLPPFFGYKWEKKPSQQNLSLLTPIPQPVIETIYPDHNKGLGRLAPVQINDIVGASKGGRDNKLLEMANALCNRFPQNQWETGVLNLLIQTNATFDPPLPDRDVLRIFRQATKFVANNPAKPYSQKQKEAKDQALRTLPIYYSQMSDEEFIHIEHREKLPMGLSEIDRIFDFPAGYYVICANPGAGKGFFALWMSKRAWLLHEKMSVYFSLEMGEPLIRHRILQSWSDLTQEQFQLGYDTATARKLMKQDVIVIYPFGQDDAKYQTPENFEKDLDEFYDKGYRVFHFDHLHELEGANNNDTNQGLVEKWAKTFQNISKNPKYHDIWLFVFAQPNGAAAAKKVIRRTDIAGSKSITQKCEFFFSLNREVVINKDTDMVEIDVENRDVIWYLDKNRITSSQHIGCKLFFSKNGNFYNSPAEENVVRMEQGEVIDDDYSAFDESGVI